MITDHNEVIVLNSRWILVNDDLFISPWVQFIWKSPNSTLSWNICLTNFTWPPNYYWSHTIRNSRAKKKIMITY